MPVTVPPVWPWIECLGVGNVAYVRDGLREWKRISECAIVTTLPDLVDDVYRPLTIYESLSGLRIIPSLKGPFLDTHDMESIRRWIDFAHDVSHALYVTGSNLFVFEFETATRGFVQGDSLDLDAVTRGASKLPAAGYVIYPEPLGTKNERERLFDFSRAFAQGILEAGGHPYWTDRRWGRPSDVKSQGVRQSVGYIEALRGDYGDPDGRLYKLFYCCANKKKYWTTEGMVPYMRHIPDGDVMVPYPGYEEWAKSGKIVDAFVKGGCAERTA